MDLENASIVMPAEETVIVMHDVEQMPVLQPTTEKTYDPAAGYYHDPLVSTTGFSIYR